MLCRFGLQSSKNRWPSWQSWQSSIFPSLFAGLKLAKLAKFTRSCFVFDRVRFHPSHLFRSAIIQSSRNLVSQFDQVRPTAIPIIPPRRAEDVCPRIPSKLSNLDSLKTNLSALRRRGAISIKFFPKCQRSIVVFSL